MNRLRLVIFLALTLSSLTAATVETRTTRYSEADMLPVRSATMTSGQVQSRPHSTPGLPAIFLIGEDARSRDWLLKRLQVLQRLRAVGLVVQVGSIAGLEQLRALAKGLTLSPVAADDLAKRLGIQHYPVLITATAIEQ